VREFKGLIPNTQRLVNEAPMRWRFGYQKDGVKTIDRMLGLGCFMLGFDRMDFVDNVVERFKSEIYESGENLSGDIREDIYLNKSSFELADKLYHITGGYRSFFSLSGSDANEGAVKLASAFHYYNDLPRKKIVSIANSYHGSTLLNLSIGTSFYVPYQLDSYQHVEVVNDDLDTEIPWEEVSCVIVETRSWVWSLAPYRDEFWARLSEIRKQYGILIIVDDIFMCGGKHGSFIGCHEIIPDIVTIGKSITGGYFPLAGTLYSPRVAKVLPSDMWWEHGFTYSFSSTGIISTIEFIDTVNNENLFLRFEDLQKETASVIRSAGRQIINSYGLATAIDDETDPILLTPLTADEEYFKILYEDLKW